MRRMEELPVLRRNFRSCRPREPSIKDDCTTFRCRNPCLVVVACPLLATGDSSAI